MPENKCLCGEDVTEKINQDFEDSKKNKCVQCHRPLASCYGYNEHEQLYCQYPDCPNYGLVQIGTESLMKLEMGFNS